MLRITVAKQTRKEVVLKVEGWVSGEEVGVLEQEGARWIQQVGRLVLDLTEVRFIDDTGIALLKRWWGNGLVLRGGSPFVRSLLETHELV